MTIAITGRNNSEDTIVKFKRWSFILSMVGGGAVFTLANLWATAVWKTHVEDNQKNIEQKIDAHTVTLEKRDDEVRKLQLELMELQTESRETNRNVKTILDRMNHP